jgi:hypothetical protein
VLGNHDLMVLDVDLPPHAYIFTFLLGASFRASGAAAPGERDKTPLRSER